MALKKQTIKYVQGLEEAKKLGIKKPTSLGQAGLYESLEEKGLNWDSNQRCWTKKKGGQLTELRIAVKSGSDLIDDYIEHVIEALTDYGFKQIGGCSKPFEEFDKEDPKKKTGNYTVWMTFEEDDDEEVEEEESTEE